MPISFTCPHCGNNMSVADQYAGQSGPCAKCGQQISIPFLQNAAAGPVTGGSKSSGGSTVMVILAVVGLGVLACGGLLAALLIPAISSAREAARRMQCQNNLRMIGLALHNYHDTYGKFPPAYTVDANGRKLHSWRTLILPFVEQMALYDQLDLNEPWDSPRNQAFAAVIPSVYRCPSDAANGPASYFTNYLAVSGPGTVLENDTPVKLSEITDGTSNTVLVVEATGTGVHWMEPRDMDINVFVSQYGSPAAGRKNHPSGGNTLLADGSVRFLPDTTPGPVRQGMATRRGGEAVPLP